MNRKTVIAIVGPTCTGKTSLSLHLARRLKGAVIGCDSRTVFKYMNIGTAKPMEEERDGVPHHLFDLIEPDQEFTVAQYKELAAAKIEDLFACDSLPIVCGGTGLYARALLEGLEIPPVSPQRELRESLSRFADEMGNEKLHDRLRVLDPITAERLSPNDRFRVIRAIEVSEVLGRPFSSLARRKEPPYETIWIGLTVEDRAYLKNAIERRMQAQLEAGLVEEVRVLFERYGCTRALMNAVNYKEFIDYFLAKRSLEESIDECIRHNYQLARRQIMWFKTNNAINWFSVDALSKQELCERVDRMLIAEKLIL